MSEFHAKLLWKFPKMRTLLTDACRQIWTRNLFVDACTCMVCVLRYAGHVHSIVCICYFFCNCYKMRPFCLYKYRNKTETDKEISNLSVRCNHWQLTQASVSSWFPIEMSQKHYLGYIFRGKLNNGSIYKFLSRTKPKHKDRIEGVSLLRSHY